MDSYLSFTNKIATKHKMLLPFFLFFIFQPYFIKYVCFIDFKKL